MQLELQSFINEFLKTQGLRPPQLVRRMGYKNVNKGMRYLTAWRRSEALPTKEQVARLARALGRPADEVEGIVQRDVAAVVAEARRRRALDRRTYLTIRYMPAVYITEVMGRDLDESDARSLYVEFEEFASRIRAADPSRRFESPLSRRLGL